MESEPYPRLGESLFPVRIVEPDDQSGEWRHGWVELAFDPSTGGYRDSLTPRYGSTAVNYVTTIDGGKLEANTRCWVRLKGSVGQQQVYEAAGYGGGSDATYNYTDIVFNYLENNTLNFYTANFFNWYGNTEWYIDTNVTLNFYGHGILIINVGFEVCGWWAWCYHTYEEFDQTIDDWLPEDRIVHRISADGPQTLTGIERKVFGGVVKPRHMALVNVSDDPIKIGGDYSGSLEEHRFVFPRGHTFEGGPVFLGKNDFVQPWYDPEEQAELVESECWRFLGGTVFWPRQQPRIDADEEDVIELEPNCHSVVMDGGDVRGFTGGQKGRHVFLCYDGPGSGGVPGTGDFLRHNAAVSEPLLLTGGRDIPLENGDTRLFVFDDYSTCWRDVSDYDENVRITPTDSLAGHLAAKTLEGTGITLEVVGDPGEYQQLRISATTAAGPGALLAVDINEAGEATNSTTDVDLTTTDDLEFTLEADALVLFEYQCRITLPSAVMNAEVGHNHLLVDAVSDISSSFHSGLTGAVVAGNLQGLLNLAAGYHLLKVQHKTTQGTTVTWTQRMMKATLVEYA